MTKCPQCGAATSSAQRFCGECGTRLQHDAAPQATDDRNAVPHRPGGGKPDPWDVGAIGDSDNGDDDFFSRFRPKSAVSGEEQIPAAPRRSRRRFEPDLNGDGALAPTPPSMPPLFEQHTDPQAAAPAVAQAQQAAAEQERARQQQERARQEQARIREQQERALQEQERARQEQERVRQEQEVRARQEQAERERRAAEERALQVQALKEQQAAREAAERKAQFEQAQNQGQTLNQGQAQNQQMPSLPTFPPNAPAEPDDATFTQLITGLDNDPADKPILADGFDRTGIVPLPPRQDAAPAQSEVSDAERQTQQRAAEFYGTGAVDPAASQAGAAQAGAAAVSPRDSQPMPSLPPLDADGGGDPTWGAGAPGEVSDQTAVLPSAQSAAQAASQDQQSPFGSPFVTEARTPEDARRAPASQASTSQTDDEDFWPFGDELDDAPSEGESRNRYQSGAGSAAAGSGAGGPAPGYDFSLGGGAGRGSGGRGGSGGPGGESEQKRRGLKTILIAAVAAVVVIIGAFVISGLVRGGDDEAPVADQTEEQQDEQTSEQPADPETNEETPTQEPETQAPANFEPVTFQSGSGNLRCQITPEGGAACQILQQNFSTPDEACTTGGNAGVAVGVNEQGITWPCLTGNLGGGQVLDYDEPVSAGDYTCSINFTTGVSCENSSGASFSLEFNSGVETNGDTAADPQFEIEPIY